MNTVLVRYGHSLCTKQYTKNPNAKYAVEAEISMKTISFNVSAKRSVFPPASGRMTPINVYLWRNKEHGDSNKCWRQRRFESSQETDVKKMITVNVSSEFISLWYANVHGAASSIQNCFSPLVLRLQKVQERKLCKTYSLTMSHPVVHMLRWKWQF